MPIGLVRWQEDGDDHFVTFSCYQRKPFLAPDDAKRCLLAELEKLRARHQFSVFGYVVIPEHLHLLVSEPENILLADVLRALKGQTSKLLKGGRAHLWQRRYYDHNVTTWDKRIEKLKYMHRNPVAREITASPADYPWSSYGHYNAAERSIVQIDSRWIQAWQRR